MDKLDDTSLWLMKEYWKINYPKTQAVIESFLKYMYHEIFEHYLQKSLFLLDILNTKEKYIISLII